MINRKHYKVDLHTHSIISYDGGINEEDYTTVLSLSTVDFVAITDHNETAFARALHKKLGEKIIVGEEILTKEGEIIGLFLKQTILPGYTAKQTIERIHEQGGLVYIPHPFETVRKGISHDVLTHLVDQVDIIEIFNGRAFFQNRSSTAHDFTKSFNKAAAASSDAHGYGGIGHALSILEAIPTRETLQKLLRDAMFVKKRSPLYTLFYPTINKMKKRMHVI